MAEAVAHRTSHISTKWKHEKRHEQKIRYILAKPQNCPKKQDQFRMKPCFCAPQNGVKRLYADVLRNWNRKKLIQARIVDRFFLLARENSRSISTVANGFSTSVCAKISPSGSMIHESPPQFALSPGGHHKFDDKL